MPDTLARLGAFDTTHRIAADHDAVLRHFGQPGFRAVHLPQSFHMRE